MSQIINNVTAKLFKEKGLEGILFEDKLGPNVFPSQSELQKWVREVHNIHIQIIAEGIDDNTGETNWCYIFSRLSDEETRKQYRNRELGEDSDLYVRPNSFGDKDWYMQEHSSYEECLEKALQKVSTFIKLEE